MAQFTANPQRHDPYKNYKFRVKWDGNYVAGVSRVSALRRSTEVVEHREGGEPSSSRRSPGRTDYEPITLERGITPDCAFEDWGNSRKDIVIEVYNEAGQLILAYKVHRCWVSKYQALPDLAADGNATLIQSITLEHEGWERDTSVPEPKEPSST